MKTLLRVAALVLVLATASMADELTGVIKLRETSKVYYLVYIPPYTATDGIANYYIMTNDKGILKQLADFEARKVQVSIEGKSHVIDSGTRIIVPNTVTEVTK